MSNQRSKTLSKNADFSLDELSNWAPQLTEEVENYPAYWALKGWKCFVSR